MTTPLLLERHWALTERGPRHRAGWELRVDPVPPHDVQALLLECGGVVEQLVAVVEAAGRQAVVELTPGADVLATVVADGPGPVDPLLLAEPRRPRGRPGGLGPDQVRRLTLAAQSRGADVLWASDDSARPDLHHLSGAAGPDQRPSATVLTPGDEPLDWLRAGRAMARLVLRARSEGLLLVPVLHALSERTTREQVRAAWGLRAWPQAQLGLRSLA